MSSIYYLSLILANGNGFIIHVKQFSTRKVAQSHFLLVPFTWAIDMFKFDHVEVITDSGGFESFNT